jgi:PAS domain S-box-containing protein
VENANDAIFIVQEGQIKFANQMAKQMGNELGVDLSRVPFSNYIHPADRDLVLERHKGRLKGENLPDTYAFRLIGQDDQVMWIELNAVQLNWDDKPATLNFLRDITLHGNWKSNFNCLKKWKPSAPWPAGLHTTLTIC